MSKRKRHKKHKKRKPSRRERRAGLDRPTGSAPQRPEPAPVAASTDGPHDDPVAKPDEAAAEDAPATEPAGATADSPAPAAPAGPAVSATFRPTTKSAETVALEQRFIGRDLRRLGIQLAAFAVIVAGLAILQAQTDVVGNLGSELFKLWE